jgi:2-amino-4-hydroxy-6-hydroxymethyldihydropteridine diphosphokinase
MSFKTILLGLGSNQGDRVQNLGKAMELLRSCVEIEKVSSLYKTEPIGPEQDDFYNLVLRGSTSLSPGELLSFVKKVEKKTGRVETYRWGPRVIDVDILFYGSETINTPDLIVPHVEAGKRRFVLEPMLEVTGNFLFPDGNSLLYYLNLALEQSCEKIRHSTF